MRRLGVLIAAVLVGLLLVSSTGALAAPAKVLPDVFELQCGDVTVPAHWSPQGQSIVFHSIDGTSRFVAFYVHPRMLPEPILDRAGQAFGAPMTYCYVECPYMGPTDMWGILTPVRGR